MFQLPKMKGKISVSIGGPTDNMSFVNNGEGSGFLSLPTKRNCVLKDNQAGMMSAVISSAVGEEPGYLNFKQHLMTYIVKCMAPDFGSLEESHNEDPVVQKSLLPNDQQWYSLNQLRIHAGAPERSEQGIYRLMQYYAQLCWLEERFPVETDKVNDSNQILIHVCSLD
jgi:hypothetical protein